MNLFGLNFATIAFFVACLSAPQAHAKIYPMQWQKQTQVHSGGLDFLLNLPAPPPPNGTKLSYYGGPVISNVHIFAVYWTDKVDPVVTKSMADYYRAVVESSNVDWLSEYNTVGVTPITNQGGTNQTIGRGKFIGEKVIQPFNQKTTINDSEIRVEIEAQVNAGNLPKPDADTLFMINMPPGVVILYDTQALNGKVPVSCQDYCAYHSNYRRPDKSAVYYSVMPDYSQGQCSFGCGAGQAFDSLTSGTAHEITEAVTDPLSDEPPVGTAAYPMAWNWDGGPAGQGEIGDICSYNSPEGHVVGKLATYIIQAEWSNSRNQCYIGPQAL